MPRAWYATCRRHGWPWSIALLPLCTLRTARCCKRCRVYTCARSAADLEELLGHSKAQGWDVQGCVADVSKPDDRQRLVAAVGDAFGGQLNVLFNNVGTNVRKKTEDYTQVGGMGGWWVRAFPNHQSPG